MKFITILFTLGAIAFFLGSAFIIYKIVHRILGASKKSLSSIDLPQLKSELLASRSDLVSWESLSWDEKVHFMTYGYLSSFTTKYNGVIHSINQKAIAHFTGIFQGMEQEGFFFIVTKDFLIELQKNTHGFSIEYNNEFLGTIDKEGWLWNANGQKIGKGRPSSGDFHCWTWRRSQNRKQEVPSYSI